MRVSSLHCSRGESNKPLSLLCHHSLNLGSEVDMCLSVALCSYSYGKQCFFKHNFISDMSK